MSLRRLTRSAPVARQILVLQVVVLIFVVAGSVGLAYTDARRDADAHATEQVLAVARTVADSPLIDQAVGSRDPSAILQPYAESVRRDTRTDFVVIMDPQAIRWTHPDPDNIGRKFIGSVDRAQRGVAQTERYTGTLGPSIRAVVPVLRSGQVVGMVSVGITVQAIDNVVRQSFPQLAVAALAVLVVGVLGAFLINRRLRRQTHGLGEREITRMYEYYDAVLHSVREGLLLLDGEWRVQLINDEAARLLGVTPQILGRGIAYVGLPESLVASLRGEEPMNDEIHLVGARMLVFNRRAATRDTRTLGAVVTVRDQTEISALSGELDTVRSLADSLRSQNHEAANRLHTVVSLIEIGRPEAAVDFATRELETAQRLTDRVVSSVDHPVVAALLLGKTAQASERGVELAIRPDSSLLEMALDPHDAVTILGNLIDNAIDATGEVDRPRRVEVGLAIEGHRFAATVEDSGPGLTEDQREQALRRGWSTKPSTDGLGRGIGLALVVQIVRREHGRIEIGRSPLGGARFLVDINGEGRR